MFPIPARGYVTASIYYTFRVYKSGKLPDEPVEVLAGGAT
jgi:hypothetical protein